MHPARRGQHGDGCHNSQDSRAPQTPASGGVAIDVTFPPPAPR